MYFVFPQYLCPSMFISNYLPLVNLEIKFIQIIDEDMTTTYDVCSYAPEIGSPTMFVVA